jgi:hypothetical protein
VAVIVVRGVPAALAAKRATGDNTDRLHARR